MIKVENMSYSFPEKDLYKDVSFTIEDGSHCVLMGSNGTGKTTLVDMIIDSEQYLYDGKITKEQVGRIGYVSQYVKGEKDLDTTVYDFLSRDFVALQEKIGEVCAKMGEAEDLEAVFEEYQNLLDESQAVDGDNYDSNIKKQLHLAGLSHLESLTIDMISGGEYKLIQVIQQMMQKPGLLIMDEPDIFLDFDNLNGLCRLINSYAGTLLVITHNRYLLNHCFDKVLHLENTDIQEFEGNFIEYNFALLKKKVEMKEQAAKEDEEIERNRKIVERMREAATNVDSATRGNTLNARVSLLNRLEVRRIKDPFVDIHKPEITLPVLDEQDSEKILLSVSDYQVSFDDLLLEHVSFELHAGEKVAIVGPNGTGKTTLLREIARQKLSDDQKNPAITISDEAELGFLSQIYGEMLDESHTIMDEFLNLGFEKEQEVSDYLKGYGFEADTLDRKIQVLSGGEKNLLQIAKIARTKADLLLLDEPTSHLDTYSQIALEEALSAYKGAVLMVSHDFYNIVNCADSILYVEDRSIRKMRIRTFRKKIYDNHFDKNYLELEQKRKELEMRISSALQSSNIVLAKELCDQLEAVIAAS